MSSLEQRIASQLYSVRNTKDKHPQNLATLRKAHATLINAVDNIVITSSRNGDGVSCDLFLYCAEAAVSIQDWGIAESCLKVLASRRPSTIALQARYLFMQCALITEKANGQVGEPLLSKTQAAILRVMGGINLALQQKDQLGYLVVQGCVHYWNAVRVLYRQGTVSTLVNSLREINQTLEAINYKNHPIRVLWMMRLAVAESSSGKDPKQSITTAIQLCDKFGLDNLKNPLKRVQYAFKLEAVKSGGQSGILRGLVACQCVYSNLLSESEQAIELQGAYVDLSQNTLVGAATGRVKGGDSSAQKEKNDSIEREEIFAELGLLAALHPLPPLACDPLSDITEERSERYRLFEEYSKAVQKNNSSEGKTITKDFFDTTTDIGILASENQLPAIAYDIAGKTSHSQSLTARVFSEFTTSVLLIQRCGGYDIQKESTSNRLTPAFVTKIMNGVKGLVKALSSALRTNNISLVQMGCILMWNSCLSLLNRENHALTAKPLQAALQALDATSSNLHRLKVQILNELAIQDLSDEYVAKANIRASQALAVDYVASEEEVAMHGFARPLDRFLVPMQQRLDLKSNLYYVPDRAAATDPIEKERVTREEVQLLLDRAQDTKQIGSLLHMLKSAQELLLETDDIVTDRSIQRIRGALWENLMTAAWNLKHPRMAPLVREIWSVIVSRNWDQHTERQLRIGQVNACFAAIEAVCLELKHSSPDSSEPLHIGRTTYSCQEPSEERNLRNSVLTAREDVNSYFVKATELSPGLLSPNKDSSDAWLVLNIASRFLKVYSTTIADKTIIQSHIKEYQVQREQAGNVAITVSQNTQSGRVRIDEVAPRSHAGISGIQAGMEILYIDGQPCPNIETYNSLLQEAASKQIVNYTVSQALSIPTKSVLQKIYQILVHPDVGLVSQCSPYNAELYQRITTAYVTTLLQEYISSKTFIPCEDDLSQPEYQPSAFSIFASDSPLLKEAEEVCEKCIAALPSPMHAKEVLFLLAATRRLQLGKVADVPVKPAFDSPQEKLIVTLEVIKNVTEKSEKEKYLKEALSDLTKATNIELCARLAQVAIVDPELPRCAIQACQLAKDLESQGHIGVTGAPVSKHAQQGEPADKKGKGGDKRQAAPMAEPPNFPPPKPTKTDFTWFCIVLQQSAIATVGLVNPRCQQKGTQTALRKKALEDLSTAATFALKGRREVQQKNLLQILNLYHSYAQPFAASVISRFLIQSSLTKLIETLSGTSVIRIHDLSEDDQTKLLDLYLCVIQTCRDRAEYQQGLKVMQQAFVKLPRTQHRPLWEANVQFRCKMNQPAVQIRDMLREVKGYDASTQYRAWLMYSRCANSEGDQVDALHQAIQAVDSEPALQSAALSELAVWLYTHNQPLQSSLAILKYACDLTSTAAEPQMPFKRHGSHSTERSSIGATSIESHSRASIATATKVATTTRLTSAPTTVPRGNEVSIAQLLTVAGSYTLLAALMGRSSSEFCVYLQLACSQYASMLLNTSTELVLRKKAATSSRRKSQRASAEGIPELNVPEKALNWIGWVVPSDVLDYLKTCKGSPKMLCPGSLEDTNFALSQITMLMGMLEEEKMNVQLLACLCIERCFLRLGSLSKSAASHALARNAHQTIKVHQQLSLEPVARYLNTIFFDEDSKPLGVLLESCRRELLEDLKEILANPPVPSAPLINISVAVTEGRQSSVYQVWFNESRMLLKDYYISQARILAQESLVHAEAWKDGVTVALCQSVLAEVSIREGRLEHADKLLSELGDFTHPDFQISLRAEEVTSILLTKVKLLLKTAAPPESLLSVAGTAEARLSCPNSAAQHARFVSYKGLFLCSFLELIADDYSRKACASLPAELREFWAAAAQKAAQWLGNRGVASVRPRLLMVQLQDMSLSQMQLSVHDPETLRSAKQLLNDQHRILLVCSDICARVSSETLPYPPMVGFKVVHSVYLVKADIERRISRNILRRHTVNSLLRRRHMLVPAVVESANPGGDEKLDAFMKSQVGIRFMTLTKKQRNIRSKTESSNYDSDDLSSSDSETEVQASEESCLYIPGCSQDYRLSPHDACSAAEVSLSNLCPGTSDYFKSLGQVGVSLLAVIESARNTKKQVLLARKGSESDPHSTAIDDVWSTNCIAAMGPVQDDDAGKGKKGGKAQDADPNSEMPATDKDVPNLAGNHTASRCRDCLLQAVEYFMKIDDWEQASIFAHNTARLYMTLNEVAIAAKYIALAQGLRLSRYCMKLFLQAAHTRSKEKVLQETLEDLTYETPSTATTERFANIQRSVYDASLAYRSLRAFNTESEGISIPQLPANIVCVTFHISDKHQHLYCSCYRSGGSVGASRIELTPQKLKSLQEQHSVLVSEQLSGLSGDVTLDEQSHESQFNNMVELMDQLISPVLDSIKSIVTDPSATNIVICACEELLSLPLELLSPFNSPNIKAVTRDISPWHYEARMEQASGGLKIDGMNYVTDIYNETGGTMKAVFAGDRKGVVNGIVGPCSENQFQALFESCAGVCVVAVPGRLCNALRVEVLAGLDLSKTRGVFLNDLSLDPNSARRVQQQDTKKSDLLLAIESPHNISLLLLCRGLPTLFANHLPVSVSSANSTAKTVISCLEKGSSIPEYLHSSRATTYLPATDSKKDAKDKDKESESKNKAAKTSLWEQCNLVTWGVL